MDGSTSFCLTPGNSDDNGEPMELDQNEETVQEGKGEAEDSDNGDIQNPFEMVDIVSLLVKYLDGKSLKSSLMVSKMWNTEGMKLFFKNNFIKVPKYSYFTSRQEEIGMINKLKASISSSTPFPNAFIRKYSDVQMFQRHKILAGAKYVKVHAGWVCEDENDNYDEPDPHEFEYVMQVLEECPNLTFLENHEYTNGYLVIEKCVETRRNGPLTISHINFELRRYDQSFQNFEKFVNSGVKVVNLDIDIDLDNDEDVKIKIPNLIQKLLHSSKDCIKQLVINLDKGSFSLVKNVPVMPQLELLSMNMKTQPLTPGFTLAFPLGFRFDKNCPNLKTFSIGFQPRDPDQNYLEEVFTKTGPASSVKHLDVRFSGQFQLDFLFQTFSKIETLHLDWNSVADLKPVWKSCQHLKALSLRIHEFKVSDSVPLLTQMTGYSKEHITTLWNSSFSVKISPLVGQPSILDLQDLEKFSHFLTRQSSRERF